MRWIKKGQVYQCANEHPLLISHASNPLPVFLKENTYRVYFSGRDESNKSSVGYVDLDVETGITSNVAKHPVFEFGKENSFYSHGVSIGNLYSNNGNDYILFMGWNIPEKQHWRGDIGRIKVDENRFEIFPETPFLGIDEEDKVSLSYPFVIWDENKYKMWYGSTIDWHTNNGEMLHVIKYATSLDGENWTKHGIAIPYELGVAQAFSRPSVMVDANGYHMWYSYRSGDGTKYRIGYAFSIDGEVWERKHEQVGITVSAQGWDSEMICYPFVFKHNNKTIMLYNGNSYGKEGFGWATLEM